MQAVIIAAGASSRFWPINRGHKSHINILGQPLVYWTIKGLADNGIKDIILIIGPNSSLKEKLSKAQQELGVNLSYIVQEEPLGTGNAIFRAKEYIKEPFFIVWPYKVNSDEIIKRVLEAYDKEKQPVILVGAKTATPWDYGILKFEGEKIVEIVENPKPGQEPSNIKTLGTYFLQPDFFEYYQKIEKHHPEDFIDALNLCIKNKEARVVSLEKELPSLKYPWEALGLLKIMLESEKLKNHVASTAFIGKNVVINGQAYIGENAVIGDNTVISGPCFVGNNCKIGASNVLRGPVNLEREVVTAAFTEIKNSLIQKGTHIHSGYFGDSIIGEDCRFGAGFVTANRRIDRGNIKAQVKGKKIDTGLTRLGVIVGDKTCFGVQAGTMPGVLIGANCLIGPGTLIFENIEDNKTVYTRFHNEKK
ncbi:MAG: bifunctional sugar-1-phosphate nucleotidylyltransferase/acetyltransferase [Candidatus Beckwithbacteria bacterium]